MFYVYRHTFSNGTLYIGKGFGDRVNKVHQRNDYWNRLYTKYGIPVKEILVKDLTEIEAFELEELIISEYKNSNVLLCNLTNGGEGSSGLVMPESAKETLRKYWTGHKQSKDTIDKRNTKLKGMKRSKEQIETYRKCKKDKFVKVQCIETGKVYPSIAEANREHGVKRSHIGAVCAGKRNTAFGYTWKFI